MENGTTSPGISARGIVKDFSGVRVLHGIDLDIGQGEVFGIIGENGAGKSTFVKILAGFHQPTMGELHVRGKRLNPRNTMAARAAGITMIHQEFNLADDLTVEGNIFLGDERTKGPFVDSRYMEARTRELLDRLDTRIPQGRKVRDLSVAEKQMVEIAKALASSCDCIIMDEPTAVLTQHEIDVLFGLIERLKGEGVTVIYISHRLREVRRICDRVAVLRDGHLVTVQPARDLSEAEMASLMVGRDVSMMFPPKSPPIVEGEGDVDAPGVALEVRNLSVPGLVQDASFKLYKGEILGFAGLVGAGRTELAEAVMGLRKGSGGEILVSGRPVRIKGPKQAVDAGLAYLSEDRKGRGILVSMNLQHNLTLMNLAAYCHPLIDDGMEKKALAEAMERYGVRAPRPDVAMGKLSGGNQQKIALAKVMEVDPDIIILDEPTRGIDVNTKQQIYFLVKALADAGKSIILISSELPEVIGLCSRVAVMRNGRITGIVTGGDVTEETLIHYATGVKEAAAL